MGDVVYIDVNDALKRVMNNTKLYAKLLTKFKNDTNLKDIEDALASGDTEKAKAASHTLKGLSANLSLIELHKQSLEMETQIKNKNIDPSQIEILKKTFALTLEEMEKVIEQYA